MSLLLLFNATGSLPIETSDFRCYIGGAERPVRYRSVNITRAVRERARATLELEVETSTAWIPPRGAEIVIYRGTSTRMFGGTISDFTSQILDYPEQTLILFRLNCIDYSSVLDKRLIQGKAYGLNLFGAVFDIWLDWLKAEGVLIRSDHLADTMLPTNIVFQNAEPISSAYRRLADLTGTAYWVDFHKYIHFQFMTLAAADYAPISISDDSVNKRNVRLTYLPSQYRNWQWIRTSLNIQQIITEIFDGDGTTRFWTTQYKMQIVVSVSVNGVSETVDTLYGVSQWSYVSGSDGLYTDTRATLLPGQSVTVRYRPPAGHLVYAKDDAEIAARKAIEGGTGIHEAIDEQQQVTTEAEALAYAEGLLRRYTSATDIPVEVEFETESGFGADGIEPGQKMDVDLVKFGLASETLLVQSVRAFYSDDLQSRWVYGIKLVRGEPMQPWNQYLDRVVEIARQGAGIGLATGGGGGAVAGGNNVVLTVAEFDALSSSQLTHGTRYSLSDSDGYEAIFYNDLLYYFYSSMNVKRPPTAWTWVNKASADNISSDKGYEYLHVARTAVGEHTYRYRDRPSTSTYAIEALIKHDLSGAAGPGGGNRDCNVGLYFSDGTKFVYFGLGAFGNSWGMAVENWNTATSKSANVQTFLWAVVPDLAQNLQHRPIWLRIEDNGTNLIFSWALVRGNWQTFHTVSRTAFIAAGPTKVGWGGYKGDSTIRAALLSWQETITGSPLINPARYFSGGADKVNWGNSSVFNLHGSMSIGVWLKLPSNATGMIIGRVKSGTLQAYNAAYELVVAGSSGAWDVRYVHDTGPRSGGSGTTLHTFNSNLGNDTWYYVGLSRDSSAKEISLYVGNGSTVSLIETWGYTNDPDGGTDPLVELQVGNIVGGSGGYGEGPLIGTIDDHLIWSRALSSTEHENAMKNSPSATNLLLRCKMGDTPEVDLSATGASGAVTGTTIVAGH